MHQDPIELQKSLAALLARVEGDAALNAELARARREFFGGDDRPDYLQADEALEVAANRFAEWFLLERTSDVLGATPLESWFDDEAVETAPMLRDTRVGMFLVESASSAAPRVRDLDGGEPLELSKVPDELHVGDLLIGRLYQAPNGTHVPSAVAAILTAAPQVAVAYQKDLKQLGLDRRLSQAELEHLLFRRWGELAGRPAPIDAGRPIERLEAELAALLEAAGKDDEYDVTEVSGRLRRADNVGAVIGPFLDEMAFETDVDLDRLRSVLVEIWNGHRAARASAGAADAPPPTGRRPRPKRPPEQRPRPRFEPRAGETLGQQLARRIEEGLAGGEPIGELFADVENLFGERIDDEEDGAEVGFDGGDLAALVREFAWETRLAPDEQATLDELVASLEAVPVPRYYVESIESDDLLRFLLERWLGSAPPRRLEAVRNALGLLDRFFAWLSRVQHIERAEVLDGCRRAFADDGERLQRASLALTPGEDRSEPDRVRLLRVTEIDDGSMRVVGEGQAERTVTIPANASRELRQGDCLLAALEPEGSGERARLVGMVVAVPADAEQLLG